MDFNFGRFLMSGVFEIGLKLLKLDEIGFFLCKVLKALNEEYQTFTRDNYYTAKTCNRLQPVLT